MRRRACQIKLADVEKVVGAEDAWSFCEPATSVAFPVGRDEEPNVILAALLTRHLNRTITPEEARRAFP